MAGQHMCCLTDFASDGPRLVSLRPIAATAAAELEAAVDRVDRGTWTEREAVARIDPARLPQLLHPRLQTTDTDKPIATGLGVSPGAASGLVVFTPEDAARLRARGRHCILVVTETGPTDIEGMKAATGILTARGGMTSHAAVVARITGKPCVAGVRTPQRRHRRDDLPHRRPGVPPRRPAHHRWHRRRGLCRRAAAQPSRTSAAPWASSSAGPTRTRNIAVRANAETVEAAKTALSFGAEGIGLARSEHMFFSTERLVALRRLILSEDEDDRAKALTGLVDYQTGDYAAIFSTMAGRPVTVRLFDPPLHEFLPRTDEDIEETAASLGLATRALRLRLDRLSEVNPMLGHRGVRLAITYPEILEMQMQALIAGVRAASAGQGEPVALEVMVPFVSTASEVTWIRERVMAHRRGSRPARRSPPPLRLRHHDRAAPRRPPRRRHRPVGRFLLVRHQRPDADHLRHLPRRCPGLPLRLSAQGRLRASIPSSPSTRRASAR